MSRSLFGCACGIAFGSFGVFCCLFCVENSSAESVSNGVAVDGGLGSRRSAAFRPLCSNAHLICCKKQLD
ncbi:Cytochrome [Trichinella pseudospiralis]